MGDKQYSWFQAVIEHSEPYELYRYIPLKGKIINYLVNRGKEVASFAVHKANEHSEGMGIGYSYNVFHAEGTTVVLSGEEYEHPKKPNSLLATLRMTLSSNTTPVDDLVTQVLQFDSNLRLVK